ncbi:MAG: alpha/beta fold hydrolase [Chloroflexi bacterium]|nr:alpha/beta fold hydrolase [Chloroflexota bacterium]
MDRRPTGQGPTEPEAVELDPSRPHRPVRKDEIVIADRGLYVESWLPERRSRRKPLYLLHGELGGSWLWERYLSYFAQRGWEGHALNLRAHFWSETADLASLDLESYVDDAQAGLEALGRPAVLVGHGMGGLLALKVAERVGAAGLVLISPALPRPIRPEPPPHVVRLVPAVFRAELIGWAGAAEHVRRQNPDLSELDVQRVQHMMGAESGLARRQMLEGMVVDRAMLEAIPTLVLGGGVDRLFPEPESKRLAAWLGASYQSFGAHSHYGLVVGETSHLPVADAIRSFLETHRL